jgi:hypothetical protein
MVESIKRNKVTVDTTLTLEDIEIQSELNYEDTLLGSSRL